MMTKEKIDEIADNMGATNPGRLNLSERKLRDLRPELFGISGLIGRIRLFLRRQDQVIDVIQWHVAGGDTRAAVVVSISPVRVAAFSDDMDCIAMLGFPDRIAEMYDLKIGTRLVTTNTYSTFENGDADLFTGPHATPDWTGFYPEIAEFISDDLERIKELHSTIEEDEWEYTQQLGEQYLRERPGIARNGLPGRAYHAAKV